MEAQEPDKPCRGKGGSVRTEGQEIRWRLKADKERFYGLVSEYCDVPGVRESYYNSGDEICWLEFCNRLSRHRILARLSLTEGKGALDISDLTADRKIRGVRLGFKEMVERGLLGRAEDKELKRGLSVWNLL